MKGFLKLSTVCVAASLLPLVPAVSQSTPVGPAPAGAGGEIANAPVTAAEARETALEFARLIEEGYVDVGKAARYAAALRTAAARGDYDRAGTVAALAQRLTRDVQAVAREGHLRITPAGAEPGPGPRMVMRRVGGPEQEVAPMEPGPGRSIEEARWLTPDVAYLRLTLFDAEPAFHAAVAKFMREHGSAKTLIVDLRTCRGGASGEVHNLLTYLYGQETAVMRADVRESVARRQPGQMPSYVRVIESPPGIVTREDVVTPHPSEQGLFDAQVIVLTSSATGSAAEHFALAIKGSGRGTVIGEVTGGAGNFAFGLQPVGEKFAAFIPGGRSYEPRSGLGWEGTGVEPSIAVPAERALIEALTRSGVAQSEAERLSATVHPTGRMTRRPPPR